MADTLSLTSGVDLSISATDLTRTRNSNVWSSIQLTLTQILSW